MLSMCQAFRLSFAFKDYNLSFGLLMPSSVVGRCQRAKVNKIAQDVFF